MGAILTQTVSLFYDGTALPTVLVVIGAAAGSCLFGILSVLHDRKTA